MLVLTRKLHQQIRIGDNITITVLRVKGNTVRIGIDAPRTTRVVRAELRPRGAGEVESQCLATSAPNAGSPAADGDDQYVSEFHTQEGELRPLAARLAGAPCPSSGTGESASCPATDDDVTSRGSAERPSLRAIVNQVLAAHAG